MEPKLDLSERHLDDLAADPDQQSIVDGGEVDGREVGEPVVGEDVLGAGVDHQLGSIDASWPGMLTVTTGRNTSRPRRSPPASAAYG